MMRFSFFVFSLIATYAISSHQTVLPNANAERVVHQFLSFKDNLELFKSDLYNEFCDQSNKIERMKQSLYQQDFVLSRFFETDLARFVSWKQRAINRLSDKNRFLMQEELFNVSSKWIEQINDQFSKRRDDVINDIRMLQQQYESYENDLTTLQITLDEIDAKNSLFNMQEFDQKIEEVKCILQMNQSQLFKTEIKKTIEKLINDLDLKFKAGAPRELCLRSTKKIEDEISVLHKKVDQALLKLDSVQTQILFVKSESPSAVHVERVSAKKEDLNSILNENVVKKLQLSKTLTPSEYYHFISLIKRSSFFYCISFVLDNLIENQKSLELIKMLSFLDTKTYTYGFIECLSQFVLENDGKPREDFVDVINQTFHLILQQLQNASEKKDEKTICKILNSLSQRQKALLIIVNNVDQSQQSAYLFHFFLSLINIIKAEKEINFDIAGRNVKLENIFFVSKIKSFILYYKDINQDDNNEKILVLSKFLSAFDIKEAYSFFNLVAAQSLPLIEIDKHCIDSLIATQIAINVSNRDMLKFFIKIFKEPAANIVRLKEIKDLLFQECLPTFSGRKDLIAPLNCALSEMIIIREKEDYIDIK